MVKDDPNKDRLPLSKRKRKHKNCTKKALAAVKYTANKRDRDKVVNFVRIGLPMESAAKLLDIGKSTLYAKYGDDIKKARGELLDKAIVTLADCLNDEDGKVRLKATELILKAHNQFLPNNTSEQTVNVNMQLTTQEQQVQQLQDKLNKRTIEGDVIDVETKE